MSFLTTFFLWGVIFRKALLVLLLKKWAKSRREERARAAPALRGEQWIISNDIIYPFSFSTPTITATLEEWKQSKFKYFKKNTFRWEKILVERNWVEWWKNNAMSRNVTNWVRSWVPINNTIIFPATWIDISSIACLSCLWSAYGNKFRRHRTLALRKVS